MRAQGCKDCEGTRVQVLGCKRCEGARGVRTQGGKGTRGGKTQWCQWTSVGRAQWHKMYEGQECNGCQSTRDGVFDQPQFLFQFTSSVS